MKNPAAVAYEAYRERMNRDTRRGVYLMDWSHLPAVEQEAWFGAIAAFVRECVEGGDYMEGVGK